MAAFCRLSRYTDIFRHSWLKRQFRCQKIAPHATHSYKPFQDVIVHPDVEHAFEVAMHG